MEPVAGDGYADVAIGADLYDLNRGKVYIYSGSALGLSGNPDLAILVQLPYDRFGSRVAPAGDVNGDGYCDLLVGAIDAAIYSGEAYLYLGSALGLVASPAWDGRGEGQSDFFGSSLATAGDVNGDGYVDLIVSAGGFDSDRGRVYLYHGSEHGLDVPFSVLTGGDSGIHFGSSVAAAGDVNGDGFADVIVGAYAYDKGETDEGAAFSGRSMLRVRS